ncbi:hypothetical protein Tco_1215823 [Tanacetum coccineum]
MSREPRAPEYHVPSDDDMQVKDQPYADDASPIAKSSGYIADSELMKEDSIDYPDEPEDNDEDPEEDPSEDHEPVDDDLEEDPSEEHEPEDEDTREEEPSEGSDKTEPFKEDKIAVTPPPSKHREARISQYAYRISAPISHRASMIRISDDIPEEDMSPQRRFVLTTPPPRCDVVESSAARPPRGTSVPGNTFIRGLEETAYMTDFMSHMKWQRHSDEDLAVRQMMRTQVLEARARIDMVEDAGSSC